MRCIKAHCLRLWAGWGWRGLRVPSLVPSVSTDQQWAGECSHPVRTKKQQSATPAPAWMPTAALLLHGTFSLTAVLPRAGWQLQTPGSLCPLPWSQQMRNFLGSTFSRGRETSSNSIQNCAGASSAPCLCPCFGVRPARAQAPADRSTSGTLMHRRAGRQRSACPGMGVTLLSTAELRGDRDPQHYLLANLHSWRICPQ